MSRCEFTQQACSDLREIHDYIARNSPGNALRFIERLEQACYHLADNPLIGRSRKVFGAGLRSLAVGRYIIFYRPQVAGVVIIHIRQESRNLRQFFESK